MPSFYNQSAWQKLRAQTRARWRRDNKPCAYCHQPLDWSKNGKASVDHIINRKQRPDLALDPANLAVVHHQCNTRKAAHVENSDRPAIGADGFPIDGEWN